jgi:hypothetical protein
MDRDGTEILEGDMISFGDGWPIEIVDVVGRVGYYEDGSLVDLTPDRTQLAKVVGRSGAVFDW